VIALAIASAIAALVALLSTHALIGVLGQRGVRQPILQQNSANAVVPPHQHKAGTPTMGGLAILGAALTGYVISHVRAGVVFSDQTLVAIVGILVMAGFGLVDDTLKIRARQNRGVYWKMKGAVSYLMSLAIATVLVSTTDIDTRLSLTRADLRGGSSARCSGCSGPARSSSRRPTQ
jgi:phospho-N-acetylmuramoyl-pentapeptide-transferase